MNKRQRRRKRHLREREETARKNEHSLEFYESEQAVKGARANRFMLVRYCSAGIFFVTLYWTVLLIGMSALGAIVTGFAFATSLVAIVECMLNVSRDEDGLRFAEKLFPVSAITFAVAIPVSLAVGPSFICPFMTSAVPGALLCLACLAVELVIMHRLHKMRLHTDKRYAWYERASQKASHVS